MSTSFKMDYWDSIKCRVAEHPDVWYRVIRLLGQGGNSMTYLAVRTEPKEKKGEHVAIKFFTNLTNTTRGDNFANEFSFLKQCDHPFVMRVFHIDTYLDNPFIVAQYYRSRLQDIISENRATRLDKVRYSLQLCSALNFLHSQNPPVIHNDIKPSNIFVHGDDCILGDFGMISKVGGTMVLDQPSFYYPTPDQVEFFANGVPITLASDIYQLGLVLTELFTGSRRVKNWQYTEEGPDYTVFPGLHPKRPILGVGGTSIKNILHRMLDVDPAARPDASRLIDNWDTVYQNVMNAMRRVEGWRFW